ncbi:MAG: sugar phosphate isomerase/epimerase [Deltaproteobacteria bacterium]|nr:MAG: sugar phosphate isomerase/epimerase [Deltaproteobacteria bacterium]
MKRSTNLIVSLSTHLFVFHPLEEPIVSLFPRYGFAFAELWAMPPHFPYDDPAAADRAADGMERHGVRIASLHAPLYPDVRTYKKDRWYSLSSVDVAHRAESVAATGRAASWLAGRGGGTVVLHTSFPPDQWYPHRWGAFLSSLNELLDAVPPGVRFAVENTPVDSGTVSVVLDIVDRYPADRVGVCLDLGHANIQENALNAVRAAGPRLIHVHASDNHASHDDHLVPGKGSVPWDRVVAALREVGFEGAFTVELRDYTRGETPPYADFGQILSECRASLDRILGDVG